MSENALEKAPVSSHQAPESASAAHAAPSTAPRTRSYPSGAAAFHDGPRGVQAKKTGVSGESTGQQMTFSNLTETQKQQVRQAVVMAKYAVGKALGVLAAAKSATNPLVKHYFKIDGTSGKDKKAIDKVIEKYNRIQSALNSDLDFTRENEPADADGSVTVAYVHTGFLGIGGDDTIHLCVPGFFTYTPTLMGKASTIIHEISHTKCGTGDHAYAHETGKWADMSQKDAIDNAESYGDFATNC